jgi:hypothetical protein
VFLDQIHPRPGAEHWRLAVLDAAAFDDRVGLRSNLVIAATSVREIDGNTPQSLAGFPRDDAGGESCQLPCRAVFRSFAIAFVARAQALPIEKRKRLLTKLLRDPHSGIALNQHYDADGAAVFKSACALGCEGIVSKRLGSPYRSGRTDPWLKIKNPRAPAATREWEEEW